MQDVDYKYRIFQDIIKFNYGPLYTDYQDNPVIQWHNVDKLFPHIPNEVARNFEAFTRYVAEALCNPKTKEREATDAHIDVFWTDETKQDLFVKIHLMGGNRGYFTYKITAKGVELVLNDNYYVNLWYVNAED